MILMLLAALQGSPEPAPLEVMSFNIRYGTARDSADAWPHRRSQVLDLLRRHDPDLLGLQEALDFQLAEIESRLRGHGRVGVGRDDGRSAGEHAAILYRRTRLELLESGTFWLSPTPDVPGSTGWGNVITRIATWARLRDRRSGRAFYVYNLHLDHESAAARDSSARLVGRRIVAREHPDPVIVMGDFNAAERESPLRFLRDSVHLTDTFRARVADTAGVGTFHGFRGGSDGARIDYVLVDRRWIIEAAGIDRRQRRGRYPSDHFPVYAVLRSRAE